MHKWDFRCSAGLNSTLADLSLNKRMPVNKKGFYSFHLPKDEGIRGNFSCSKKLCPLLKIQGQNINLKHIARLMNKPWPQYHSQTDLAGQTL
jgi:hypothetical protein